MKRLKARQSSLSFILILGVLFIPGCGGNDTGHWTAPDNTAPTVTAVVPLNGATGVAINVKRITAAFSEAMDSATLTTASFTLACPAGTPVTGAVSYLTTGNVARLILPASPNLPINTVCTATITTGAKDVAGNPLASNFVWTFTTGATEDTTRPRVTLTVPATTTPGPTTGVATNTAITAVFSEDMDPATLADPATSFTLTCAPSCVSPSPAGNVTYAVGSRIATFTPTAVLETGKTYTATIKGTGASPATDLADNALAGNASLPATANDYVWTFTTSAAAPAAGVSVSSSNPAAGAAAACSNTSVNATFSVPSGLRMDPLSVNSGTFTVTGPGSTVVTAASVLLDVATGRIATFTPTSSLTSGVTYTATIKSGATGVKDLALPANTMATDFSWTFTAGPSTVNCQAPEPLNAAASFGFFSSAALTNQGDAPNTTITGNVGTTSTASSITGLHDTLGRTYTETCPAGIAAVGCGLVAGTIYASNAPVGDPVLGTQVTAAAAAALVAFNNLAPAARAGGLDVRTNSLVGAGGSANELGGRTLAPGLYYSQAGGVPDYQITTGDLTLDAQGNANAVWVFQTAAGTGTLLVSTPTGPVLTVPRTVHLTNGAQAKNVFWYVPAGATINTGSNMVGTMISSAAITFGTATGANPVIITRLEGRALVLAAGATMVNTVVNVPAP